MKKIVCIVLAAVLFVCSAQPVTIRVSAEDFSLPGTWEAADGTTLTFYDDGTFVFDWASYGTEDGEWYAESTAGESFPIEMNGSTILMSMMLIYGALQSNYHFEVLKWDANNIDLVQVYGDYTAQTSPCKLALTREGYPRLSRKKTETTVKAESKNKIEVKSIPFFVADDRTIHVDANWGWDLFNKKASEYDHNLTMAALLLSSAAEESVDKVKSILTGTGKSGFGFEHFDSKYFGDDRDISCVPTALASKQIVLDGQKKIVIAIVCPGTELWTNDVISDIFSPADGFLTAGKNTKIVLQNYITKIKSNHYYDVDPTSRNTILFFSGHSLGGAVCQMATFLSSELLADRDQIFTYTLASPNIAVDNSTNSRNRPEDYMNVHNIINDRDLVPDLPVFYSKLGHCWHYKEGFHETDDEEIAVFGSGWNAFTAEFNIFYNHLLNRYLTFVLSGLPSNAPPGKKNPYSLSSVHCPVDITVYNNAGELMGYTVGESAYFKKESSVIVYCDGSSKYIAAPEGVEYTIKFAATGDGMMTYVQQSIDGASNQILSEKKHENVAVQTGDVFKAVVSGGASAEDTVFVRSSEKEFRDQESPDDLNHSNNGKEINAKKVIIIIVAAVAVMAALAALIVILKKNQNNRTTPADREKKPVPVSPQEKSDGSEPAPPPEVKRPAAVQTQPSAPAFRVACRDTGHGGVCGMCGAETDALFTVKVSKGEKTQSRSLCGNCTARIMSKYNGQNH